MGFRQIANFDSSIGMNCQTEIDGQILIWKMEKFFCNKILVCHMIAGSLRILGSTFPYPEVPENLKSGSFSQTVTLTPGRTSATVLGKNFLIKLPLV